MKIVRLHPRNNQLPAREEMEVGDIAVMSHGDIFCYLGDRWILLGGRFLPSSKREVFLSYVKNGWPDLSSMRWDMEPEFDMKTFVPEDGVQAGTVKTDPKWVGEFLKKILEI